MLGGCDELRLDNSMLLKFTRLKELKLWCEPEESALGELLSELPDLEKLYISGATWGPAVANAVADASPSLKRHKRLIVHACIPGDANDANLSRMFERIGKTLVSVSLRLSAFDVKKLAIFCPVVSDISIEICDSTAREDELELYCIYGSQLKSIKLNGDGFSDAFLHRLGSACPNALVNLRNVELQLTPTTQTHAPQFSYLRLQGDLSYASVASAQSRLHSVQKLDFDFDDKMEEAFFLTPKPRLQELNVCCTGSLDRIDEVLLTIAANKGGLLSCSLRGKPSVPVLEKLARANPLLQHFRLCLPPVYDEDVRTVELECRYMVHALESFAECRELRSISLRGHPVNMNHVARVT